ncbi:MAG: MGMT family protein [Bacteroidota bacterium]
MTNRNYVEDVFELTRLIPQGRVSTYGAIADALALGSARMVGWALRQCLSMDNVPAHRVVNRKGELSGRLNFETPTRMQELLESEGVIVKNHKVQDFDELFWHPASIIEED